MAKGPPSSTAFVPTRLRWVPRYQLFGGGHSDRQKFLAVYSVPPPFTLKLLDNHHFSATKQEVSTRKKTALHPTVGRLLHISPNAFHRGVHPRLGAALREQRGALVRGRPRPRSLLRFWRRFSIFVLYLCVFFFGLIALRFPVGSILGMV